MDHLERELRAMLEHRANEVPGHDEMPAGLAGRAARRRTLKLAVAATGAVLAGVLAVAAITTGGAKSAPPRVITSTPTSVPRPSPTTTGSGATEPTTVAVTTTTITTPPATTPPGVPSTGCPTNSVFAPFHAAAPVVGARAVPGLDPSLLGRVRSFVGPRAGFPTDARVLQPDVVLGPGDWSCRVFQSNGGGALMYVFPASAQGSFGAADSSWTTSEQYAGPEVRVTTAVLGHLPDASFACSVFASEPLVAQWVATSGIGSPCAAPAGRQLTKLAAGEYSFVDADGTRGVGVMRVAATTPQLDGDYGIVTCRLTGAEASLCDAIISDYVTRYPGKVPGA